MEMIQKQAKIVTRIWYDTKNNSTVVGIHRDRTQMIKVSRWREILKILFGELRIIDD